MDPSNNLDELLISVNELIEYSSILLKENKTLEQNLSSLENKAEPLDRRSHDAKVLISENAKMFDHLRQERRRLQQCSHKKDLETIKLESVSQKFDEAFINCVKSNSQLKHTSSELDHLKLCKKRKEKEADGKDFIIQRLESQLTQLQQKLGKFGGNVDSLEKMKRNLTREQQSCKSGLGILKTKNDRLLEQLKGMERVIEKLEVKLNKNVATMKTLENEHAKVRHTNKQMKQKSLAVEKEQFQLKRNGEMLKKEVAALLEGEEEKRATLRHCRKKLKRMTEEYD